MQDSWLTGETGVCRARQQEAREEFVVAGFIEPRAFDVKEPKTRNEARQRECVNRQLRDGFVRARIGLGPRESGRMPGKRCPENESARGRFSGS